MDEEFVYGYSIMEEEKDKDPWYKPKENWDNLPKEFLPPEGTCNINFCTDINLRALDAMAQKDRRIEELEKELEQQKSSNEIFKEQNEILMKKNKSMIEMLRLLA